MTGSQISHDLYKYVPLRLRLRLLETYKLLLVLYELLLLNTHTQKSRKQQPEIKSTAISHRAASSSETDWIILRQLPETN